MKWSIPLFCQSLWPFMTNTLRCYWLEIVMILCLVLLEAGALAILDIHFVTMLQLEHTVIGVIVSVNAHVSSTCHQNNCLHKKYNNITTYITFTMRILIISHIGSQWYHNKLLSLGLSTRRKCTITLSVFPRQNATHKLLQRYQADYNLLHMAVIYKGQNGRLADFIPTVKKYCYNSITEYIF